VGHFQRGRYEEAVNAARKAIQFNPGFSINYVLLAAPLARRSRLDEARTAAARVLELQPSFSISKQFNSVGCARDLTALLTDALLEAGFPDRAAQVGPLTWLFSSSRAMRLPDIW
jgi:tetratricopeptide (TPR) repeat protein